MKRGSHIVLAAVIVCLSGLCLFLGCSVPIEEDRGTAAIVDQLYSLQPNPLFINRTTESLQTNGFQVDLYQGEQVTVDFYRKLPTYGYKLIIFRSHSGLLVKEGEMAEGTWLFTDEPHSRTKYVNERLAGSIVKARTAENKPWLFAIGSEFVARSMEGQFDNTVIIMMRCYCLYLDDLAQAFSKKGAAVYIGWDGNVGLEYVDQAAIELIENLLTHDMTIDNVVNKTISEIGADPDWDTRPGYFPAESGNKTVKELSS
ncbi:hypothetical protein ACFLXT_00530 [Chloroflexota bacterium]